ncbi:MAG TPA: hypothetical protein VI893_09515 [Thermoplasmata archaeon]|nr:hypothetical protein [Thermoplasmata archaeon]
MRADSLDDVALLVARELRARGIRFCLTGMYAGLHWLGKAAHRMTFDVDFSVWAPMSGLRGVVDRLSRNGWELTTDLPSQISLRAKDTMFRIDLLPARFDPDRGREEENLNSFFQTGYLRAARKRVGRISVRVARPEEIIVLKLLLGRPTKDDQDVRMLLRLKAIDRAHLRRQARLLGLESKLIRAVESLASATGPEDEVTPDLSARARRLPRTPASSRRRRPRSASSARSPG